jgi:hypothetical protein
MKKGEADASTNEIIARARKVRTLLQSSSAEALALLAKWRLFTLRALRLDT